MTFLFFFSLFAGLVLSLVAYLQADAAWWKGPLAALGLLVFAMIVALFISEEGLQSGGLPPFVGAAVGAVFGAILIGAGSVLALILRIFWTPGEIAKVVFLGGWLLGFVGLTTLALS